SRCYSRLPGATVELVAVAARSMENAARFAGRWNIRHAFDDWRRLLDRPDIDLLDICTPNFLHREMVITAAQARKHSICTKPLTGYFGESGDESEQVPLPPKRAMLAAAVRDAEQMVREATRYGVLLMYAENWIYAPAVQKARRLIEVSGGAILSITGGECHSGSHSPFSKRWRISGGGALLRLASHPVGAALYFKRIEGLRRTGVPIRAASVMAETGRLSALVRAAPSDSSWLVSDWEDVEDWGTILVTFTDGTKAVLAGSDVQLGGLQSTLELCLSNARLICRLSPTNLCEAYAPHDAIFDGEYLLEKLESRAGRSYPAPDEQWAHGHLHMLEDCVQAVQTGRPPQSDGQLGRDVVEIIYAAYASAEEGRRIDLAPVGGT
ncbi:MAG: oxidoreductase, partial [Chloroflexota bacterium]